MFKHTHTHKHTHTYTNRHCHEMNVILTLYSTCMFRHLHVNCDTCRCLNIHALYHIHCMTVPIGVYVCVCVLGAMH